MVTLHDRLRYLRQQAHWHLSYVAKSADITVSFLSDLERGRTLPSLETLERIAEVYGLTIGELLVNVRIRQEVG